MTTLAFDTSTEILALTLQKDDKHISITRDLGLHHSEQLLVLIDQLLEMADINKNELELIACAAGPGSFMGLRVGFATAKALSAGLKIPYISIPSLDLYAAPHHDFKGKVIPLIDAKRKRFYTAVYENGTRISDYMDAEISDIHKHIDPEDDVLFTGPHASLFKERNPDIKGIVHQGARQIQSWYLAQQAIKAGEQGKFDVTNSEPMYLRKSDAEIALEQKKA